MNITLVGPGAIGSLWACALQDAGHQVHLWTRNGPCQQASQLPRQLVGYQPPEQLTRAETIAPSIDQTQGKSYQFSCDQLSALQQTDLLIITTKASQVESALAIIRPHLVADTIILLMHNGMGTLDQAIPHLHSHPLLVATTSHGVHRPQTSQIIHKGLGITHIGPLNALGQQCDFLQAVLQHALPEVHWQADIQPFLWQKLLINAVINPLTAYYQCKNGALQHCHQATQQQLIAEAVAVMQAIDIPINMIQATALVEQVISATAANYSSMYQDIAQQKPTEIRWINGYVIRKAQAHNIPVPTHHTMLQQIEALEARYGSAADDQSPPNSQFSLSEPSAEPDPRCIHQAPQCNPQASG